MLEVKIDFQSEEVLAALDNAAHESLDWASDLVAREARIKAPQGPTSNLKQSIQPGPITGSFTKGSLEVTVSAGVPYATYVEFGTGIWGPEGKWIWIEPVDAFALRWEAPGGDGYHFSKGHYVQGVTPRPYLNPAVDENADLIADGIGAAMELAMLRLSKGKR